MTTTRRTLLTLAAVLPPLVVMAQTTSAPAPADSLWAAVRTPLQAVNYTVDVMAMHRPSTREEMSAAYDQLDQARKDVRAKLKTDEQRSRLDDWYIAKRLEIGEVYVSQREASRTTRREMERAWERFRLSLE